MLVLRARPTLQVPQHVLLRHVLLHVPVHFWSKLVRLVQYLYPYPTLPHVCRGHELCGAVLPAGAEGGGLGRLGFVHIFARLELSKLLLKSSLGWGRAYYACAIPLLVLGHRAGTFTYLGRATSVLQAARDRLPVHAV